ncbi:MAG: YciI family protein [Woeseiaceae bacterium]|nr:YciI family protein [Woeseiaceae bacterium]
MADYIIAYIGGRQPATPEEGKAQKEKWDAWITNLGDAIVNPGTPLAMSKTIGPDGVADADPDRKLTGFSIVRADSLDDAIAIAKECPFLEMGTLEVAQVMQM